MLKSRSTFPPGGFQYFQAQTGWRLPAMQDFNTAVGLIQAHRRQNPRFGLPTDFDEIADELDNYQCAILNNDPNWCMSAEVASFLPGRLPPQQAAAPSAGGVAGATRLVKNLTVGIRTYLEWFGSGKPVEKALASARAAVCVKCPQHVKMGLYERFSKEAADEAMKVMGLLKSVDLRTPLDDQLHICDACDCPLRAKIWCPLDIILKHIPSENFERLDPGCWMRSEKKS